jgi:DNA-binding MarR family transcriptional regulator
MIFPRSAPSAGFAAISDTGDFCYDNLMDRPLDKPAPPNRDRPGAPDWPHNQRAATLARILGPNPILDAYVLNYLANFYVGPLLKVVESRQGLTRPEWIVIFCLTQQPGLNAQQISDVTGRAKSSISHAVKLLQKKRLLRRRPDTLDGRRRVLELTDGGREAYRDLIPFFVEREAAMLACLSDTERRSLRKLMLKLTDNMESWAKSY